MKLHDIKPNPGAKHRKRRVGNGESSGLGKTCGRGHKGQKSRSGATVRPNFEGGQMPIFRRLPKKGFNNAQFKTKFAIVNLSQLEAKFENGDTVNEESLRACGLVKGIYDAVKVLGKGELSKKLTVEVDKLSASAREKIESAGGKVVELEPKPKQQAKAKAESGDKEKTAKAKEEPKKTKEKAEPKAEEKKPAKKAAKKAEAKSDSEDKAKAEEKEEKKEDDSES